MADNISERVLKAVRGLSRSGSFPTGQQIGQRVNETEPKIGNSEMAIALLFLESARQLECLQTYPHTYKIP